MVDHCQIALLQKSVWCVYFEIWWDSIPQSQIYAEAEMGSGSFYFTG